MLTVCRYATIIPQQLSQLLFSYLTSNPIPCHFPDTILSYATEDVIIPVLLSYTLMGNPTILQSIAVKYLVTLYDIVGFHSFLPHSSILLKSLCHGNADFARIVLSDERFLCDEELIDNYLDILMGILGILPLAKVVLKVADRTPSALIPCTDYLVAELSKCGEKFQDLIMNLLVKIGLKSPVAIGTYITAVFEAIQIAPATCWLQFFQLLIIVSSVGEHEIGTVLSLASLIVRRGLVGGDVECQWALLHTIDILKDSCHEVDVFHVETLSALSTISVSNREIFQNIMRWNSGES